MLPYRLGLGKGQSLPRIGLRIGDAGARQTQVVFKEYILLAISCAE